MKNERRFPRYKCNQRLLIRYRADGHDAMAFGRCLVVGKGGIGAQVPADLAIGQITQLEITLPSAATPRRIKAQVRSRHQSNYGFEFMDMDALTLAVLAQLFQPQALLTPAALQSV